MMYLQTPRALVEGSWIAMFSASKVGGSRGSRSLLPGWHPPPTHHLKVQPGFFIVHWRAFLVERKFLVASTRGNLPLVLATELLRRRVFSESGLPETSILGNSEA